MTYDCRSSRKRGATPAVDEQIDAGSFALARLGFPADAKQMDGPRLTAKRAILNCSRQLGKSTVAAEAVHWAFTRPGYLVLVLSPCERQSAEFLRKTAALVRKPDIQPRGDGGNAISLLFPNGSRIVELPGTEATVRGFSASSLILIDEASRVEGRHVYVPAADAGGGRGGFVADEHAERAEGVLLRTRAGYPAEPG